MSEARTFAQAEDFVRFAVDIKGERLVCWISGQALSEHFGATTETRVGTLVQHLDKIAAVAASVARTTPTGKHILVRTQHFGRPSVARVGERARAGSSRDRSTRWVGARLK